MRTSQAFGVVMFAIGASLLAAAYHALGQTIGQASSVLIGDISGQAFTRLVVGTLAVLAGGLLVLFKGHT